MMCCTLEPPHAQRGDVKHEGDKPDEEHDPSTGEAECFAVVQREEPSQKRFAAGKLPPIVDAKDLTAVLIQPDLALTARFHDLARLAQTDSTVASPSFRTGWSFNSPIVVALSAKLNPTITALTAIVPDVPIVWTRSLSWSIF